MNVDRTDLYATSEVNIQDCEVTVACSIAERQAVVNTMNNVYLRRCQNPDSVRLLVDHRT